MGAPFDWTAGRLRTLMFMWRSRAPIDEIGGALGCCGTTAKLKAREIGLGNRRHDIRSNSGGQVAAAAKEMLARRDAEALREGRDLTGQFFGDPQPWKSALAQPRSVADAAMPKISLGSMKRDLLRHTNSMRGLTTHLLQARREREARA